MQLSNCIHPHTESPDVSADERAQAPRGIVGELRRACSDTPVHNALHPVTARAAMQMRSGSNHRRNAARSRGYTAHICTAKSNASGPRTAAILHCNSAGQGVRRGGTPHSVRRTYPDTCMQHYALPSRHHRIPTVGEETPGPLRGKAYGWAPRSGNRNRCITSVSYPIGAREGWRIPSVAVSAL